MLITMVRENWCKQSRQELIIISVIPFLGSVCSAGVGRTGTYIALDIIMDHAEQQNTEINIYNIVDKLREDRCHMVQNKVGQGDAYPIFCFFFCFSFPDLVIYVTSNAKKSVRAGTIKAVVTCVQFAHEVSPCGSHDNKM